MGEMVIHLFTKIVRCICMPIRCLVLCPLTCCVCCLGGRIECVTTLCKMLCGDGFDGIVAGHAYTVLGTAVVPTCYGPEARIVKLRNPYGKIEWKGLFSDGSCAWTDEAREITGHEEDDDADDGVFWMHLSDFMSFLQVVAVCYSAPGRARTLDKRPEGKPVAALCIEHDDVDDDGTGDDERSPFSSVPSHWYVTVATALAGKGTEQAGIILNVQQACHFFVTVD